MLAQVPQTSTTCQESQTKYKQHRGATAHNLESRNVGHQKVLTMSETYWDQPSQNTGIKTQFPLRVV